MAIAAVQKGVEMVSKRAEALEFTVPTSVSTAVKVTRNPVGTKSTFLPMRPRKGRGGGTSKKIPRKLNSKTRRQFGGTFQQDVLDVFNFVCKVTLEEFLKTGSLNCLLIQQRAEELFDNLSPQIR